MQRTLNFSALTDPVDPEELAAFAAEMGGAKVKWRPRAPRADARFTSRALLVIFVIVPLVIAAGVLLISIATGLPGIAVSLLPTPVLLAAFAAYWAIPTVRRPFRGFDWETIYRLARFGADNDLDFSPSDVGPSYQGVMFQNIPNLEVYNHFQSRTGPYFDMGNLRYNVQINELSEIGHRGFLALKLDRKLPQIILDAKANNLIAGSLASALADNSTVKLEGDFDKHFTLICPPGYERDALYVLTPNLMALLIDDAGVFDVEIIDDWMFVYSMTPHNLLDRALVERLFRIVDGVGATAGRSASLYRDERSGGFTNNTVAVGGRRLSLGLPPWFVVLGGALVLSVPWAVFSGFFTFSFAMVDSGYATIIP